MQTISYTIREIVYDTGKTEVICMTPQQYSGFQRRKGIKKKILSNKKLFTFEIKLRNHIKSKP